MDIAFEIITKTAFIWGPILCLLLFWRLWVYFLNYRAALKVDGILLNIKIPKEILKSPQAMELFFDSAMYQKSPNTWWKKYVLGEVRPWWSLEIVSIEGAVYFFIWTPKFWKDHIEAQLYAQYPQAEVIEVPDYTDAIANELKDGRWEGFFSHHRLTKPDAYPIKTYIDYGLDKAVGSLDENQRIDPITSVIEWMGSIGPGEQIWMQILVQATKKRFPKGGSWFGKTDWKDEAYAEIEKIINEHGVSRRAVAEGEEQETSFRNLSKGKQETVSSIERSIDKYGYDCGVRTLYLAESSKFRAINIKSLLSAFQIYSSPGHNGFAPDDKNITGVDFPWQDPTDHLVAFRQKRIFNSFRMRSMFYPPHIPVFGEKKGNRKPFVLTSEELATIFHFPGTVSETPSFSRIDSKKAEPPSNLPL
ncbi:MAG: hypothetical protein ACI9AR_000198 [Flavobacteriaceae bacterium]|jgi:hypothetical protein